MICLYILAYLAFGVLLAYVLAKLDDSDHHLGDVTLIMVTWPVMFPLIIIIEHSDRFWGAISRGRLWLCRHLGLVGLSWNTIVFRGSADKPWNEAYRKALPPKGLPPQS